MKHLSLFLLAALLVVTGGALNQEVTGGADAETSDRQAEVAQLVRQLDDSTLARRDAAEAKLLEMGSDILELLPAISDRLSAEQRQRLTRVREALERIASEEAVKASHVTLSEITTMSAVLRALENQTGNRVLDYRLRFGQEQHDPEVAVAWDDTPYWEALDDLLDQAGLTLYPYPGQASALALVGRTDDGERLRQDRASYYEIFRIESTTISATRDLRRPEVASLAIKLEIGWEPRVSPIRLLQSLEAISAVDENGDPIDIAGSGVLEFPIQPTAGTVELTVPLGAAPRHVKQIASLQGEFRALVPGRIETFEFPLTMEIANDEQRKGGVSVIVESVRKSQNIYDVRMLVRYDEARNALDSHLDWVIRNVAQLLDAEGEIVQHVGFETTRQGRNELGIAYKFILPDGIDNCRFVYRTPASLVELTVPYELEHIPLP